MTRHSRGMVLSAIVAAAVITAGCGNETPLLIPNEEPNTRISAGPPEATDTGYQIDLFWFGWDDDGYVDHYEIAWETPENWIGPIFSNDSLFSVMASESCCVTPLPEFGPQSALADSVYEQYHTFYVRAVDNNGVPDPTPAVRSFNAKTVAPNAEITFGPRDGSRWGPSVEFEWTGKDDDGVVVEYERALATGDQYRWDNPGRSFTYQDAIAWLDTLSYYPTGPSARKDSSIWASTDVDSVVFPELSLFDAQGGEQLYLFAVRAIDNAGAKEQRLTAPDNVRRFNVSPTLAGPILNISSNSAGSWRSGEPTTSRAVFAGQGLRFQWRATPGQAGVPVAAYSYAVEDTARWEPFSANTKGWPVQVPGEPEVLWFPPEGPHRLFVRAIDLGGFISVLEARLDVYGGPKKCAPDPQDDTILVVLDTAPSTLVTTGILPLGYAAIERTLVDYWFEGFNYQVFESDQGRRPLDIAVLNCATSTVWFCSASIDDDSILLLNYHKTPPNPLSSYVAAGGNLFVLGTQPVLAMRYFDFAEGNQAPQRQQFPVRFATTLTDSTYLPHWASTRFGISSVGNTIGSTTSAGDAPNRLRVAKAVVPGYPDLPFDPLTWPEGPLQRGFGYYDYNVVPIAGSAEVIYRRNSADSTAASVGVRRLMDPGTGGSTVYLGLHPYFVERPAFKTLVRAVLTSFGETLNP